MYIADEIPKAEQIRILEEMRADGAFNDDEMIMKMDSEQLYHYFKGLEAHIYKKLRGAEVK